MYCVLGFGINFSNPFAQPYQESEGNKILVNQKTKTEPFYVLGFGSVPVPIRLSFSAPFAHSYR